MATHFDLTGRVALVTGGAQRLGACIARALADHGAMLDLQAKAVAASATQLARDPGREVIGLACDTRKKDQVEACVKNIVERFGRIDILANNAGIHRRGTPTDYQRQDLTDVFAVNLVGCNHVAGAVGRMMLAQQRGRIVNVSALGGGIVGLGRGGLIYAMTKGGIVSLTRGRMGFTGDSRQHGGSRLDSDADDTGFAERSQTLGQSARTCDAAPLGRIRRCVGGAT